MSLSYRKVVEEMDSPHVRREPSPSFAALLRTAHERGDEWGYIAELAVAAGVDRATSSRVLSRMVRLELADRCLEQGSPQTLGRHPRVYYRLTPAGHSVAENDLR